MPPIPPRERLAQDRGAFGRYLRAARLGFRPIDALGAWVRISDDGAGWRVDLVPIEMLVPATSDGRGHTFRAWWEEDPRGEHLLASAPALRRIRAVKRPCSFVVGDDGELLPTPPRERQRRAA